jgi:hypothetical protein
MIRGALGLRRKRDGSPKGTAVGKLQDAQTLALEWRKRLQIEGQFRPDIAQILIRPKTAFPHIRVKTFAASAYRKQRVKGWANAQTRTINLADSVERGLKYGDPQSRWDAIQKTKSDSSQNPLEANIEVATRQSESASHTISEDEEVIGALIRDANRTIRRYRRSIKASLGAIIMVIGCLPLLTNSLDGKIKIGALAATGLIGAALSFLQIVDRPIGLEKRLETLAWRIIKISQRNEA